MNSLTEHQVFVFLVQFAILLGFSRWLGLVFQRFNQPTITAEILVGVILGPTVLGRLVPRLHAWLFPQDPISMVMIETVAWIGILFLLLETGLEVNFSRIWRQKGQAVKIAISDIVLPILLSGFFIYWLPDRYLPDPGQRWIFTGFIATIMTISALPISIRVMHDVNILKTDMGFLVISALTINDIIGWVIFALLLGSVSLHTTSILGLAGLVVATIGYTFFTLKYLRQILDRMIRRIKELYTENMALAVSLISVLGMISGAITLKIGIHALFGFFILGMAAGESSALSEKDRITISRMVYAIFVPVFFAGIGLKIDFITNFEVVPALLITLVGIGARYGGAYLGSIWARAPKANRDSISIAHTPGGQMEIVIGMLALQIGIISQPIFVAIVFGALISSFILGPWLTLAVKRRKIQSVLPYLNPRHVTLLNAKTKRQALLELTQLIAGDSSIPAQRFYRLARNREEGMSSAVEFGIAFPHARVPNLTIPMIAVGISRTGIEWDSPDGQPSRLIVLIVTPESQEDAQLQFLRLFSICLSDEKIRHQLLNAGDNTQVYQILSACFTPGSSPLSD